MKKLYFILCILILASSANAQPSIPFTEDFESGQNGWISGGTNSSWAFGTPNKLSLTSAPSGSNAWVMGGLSGGSNSSESSWVQSPEYDFSSLTNPAVSAKVRYRLIEVDGYVSDSAFMQYSVNQGASWTTIDQRPGFKNWYSGGWKGSTEYRTIDILAQLPELAAEPTVTFRLKFNKANSWQSSSEGFIFDDFKIYEYPETDLQVNSLSFASSRYLSDVNPVGVVVYNNGTSAINSSIDMSYSLDGGATQTESFNLSIPSFTYDTVRFTITEDMSVEKLYSFDIWASTLAADTIQENDTIVSQVRHYVQVAPNLPYLNEFESYISESGTSSEKVVNNSPEFELKLANESDLQVFYTITSQGIEGEKYLHMEARDNTQYLIGHFDMSAFSIANDNLLLSFISNGTAGSNNTLELRGSKDDPWIDLDTYTSNQLRTYGYPISSLLSANGQDFSSSFQFRFTNQTNKSLNLDNLKIEVMEDNDLGLVSQSLANGRDLGATEALTIDIFNKGALDQTGFDVSYQIDSNPVVTETVSATLASVDSVSYTFSSSLDLSAIADYNLKVWTDLGTDTNAANDTLEVVIQNYGRPSVSLPYQLDFDDMDLMVQEENGDSIALDPDNRLDFTTSTQAHGNYRIIDNSYAIENKSIGISTLYSSSSSLTWNLNLSNYAVATEKVSLSFDYKSINDNVSPEDQVMIRGSEADPWIVLFNWNEGSSLEVKSAFLNISDSLLSNSQEFSTSTQIRFTQKGASSFGNDGLVIDNLEVAFLPANDLSVKSLKTDIADGRELSSTQSFTVVVENRGLNDLSNFNLGYQQNFGPVIEETVSRTVSALDTIHHTFLTPADLTADGSYDIKFWSDLTGDENQSNDSISTTVINYENPAISLPFLLDFEEYEPYFYQGDSALFGTNSRFDFNNYLDRGQIRVTDGQYAIDGNSVAFSSTAQSEQIFYISLNMENYAVANNKINLEFDYKNLYDDLDASDVVQVRGSTNDSWIKILDWNTGEMNTTIHSSINISDILQANGQEFSSTSQVRFVQNGRSALGSDGLVIDNIFLKELSPADLGAISSDFTRSSLSFTNAETLSVNVYNYGYEAQTSFDLFYQIDNETAVQETVSTTINPEDTLIHTFATPLDLSVEKDYAIKIWTSLAADTTATNDSLNFTAIHIPLTPFPYVEDFQNGDGGWTVSGNNNSWAYGQVEKLGYDASMADSAWALGGLTGQYSNNELSYLLSPFMNLSSIDSAYLSLDLSYDIESNSDELNLQYTTDGGTNWNTLTTGISNWFTGSGWTGNSNGIVEAKADISHLKAFSEIQFRFMFDSDGSAMRDGAIINNIRLVPYPKAELTPVSTNLQSSRSLKNNEELLVEVANVGIEDQQSFDIYYQIDGGTPVVETVSSTVVANDTLTYAFNSQLDLSTDKVYQINIWTDLATDENRDNDTLSLAVEKYSNPVVSLPLSLDFETDVNFFKEGDSLFISEGGRLDFLTVNEAGRIQVFSGNQYAIDNKTLALTGNSFQADKNELILNLNLQNYLVADNKITFDFDYIDVFDEDQAEDKVYIRGSKMDSWIELLDWNTFDEGSVLHASLNISDSLLAAGQEFSNGTQIKFTQNVNGALGAEGLVLDNLVLEEQNLADLGVLATSIPSGSGVFTSSESLKVDFYNYGYNDQQNFDVYYQLDGTTPVQETVSDLVVQGDTLSFTFATPLDLSVEKDYEIKIWTALAGDQDQSNDTLMISTTHYAITSVPYAEAFENDNGNWTAGGTNSSWVYGQPNKLGYNSNQTNLAWALGGLDGQYNNSELSYIESPLFDVTTIDSTYLAFDINYDIESGWDYLKLQYSADNGASWTTLTPGLVNWQNNNGWTGASNQVARAEADITALKSFNEVKFRFYFDSDAVTARGGAIIDNIEIASYPQNDMEILSTNLRTGRTLGDNQSVEIQLVNNGINAQQNFDVFYQVGQGAIVQETVSTSINGRDSLLYTFNLAADFSVEQVYEIDLWTGLATDENKSNDTLSVTIEKFPNPLVELPLVLDFEDDSLYLQEGDSSFFGESRRFDFRSYLNRGQVQIIEGNNAIEGQSLGLSSVASSQQILTVNLNMATYQVANDKVRFEFDYKNLDDELNAADIVRIRGNSNQPWIKVYDWNTGVTFSTLHVSLNLSTLLLANGQEYSASTQIEFVQDDNSTLGSDGLVIDNIEFTQISADDLGVLSSNIPAGSTDFSSTESLTVDIYNYGFEAKQGFNVFYQLDSETIVQEAVTATVNPEDTLSYTFNTPLDLSAEKLYQLKSWTELVGDTTSSNDTLQVTVNHFPIFTAPYQQDFENGSGYWTSGGTSSSWEYGIPSKLGYDSTQNNHAWVLGGLAGEYNNNELSYLESGIFDLSNFTNGYLAFDINYDLESGFDDLNVQYSLDDGQTWSTITNGTNSWYSSGGFTGLSNGMQRAMTDISNLAGNSNVRFRFYFDSDEIIPSSGAVIDNIELDNFSQGVDLKLLGYNLVNDTDPLTASEMLEATVVNLGSTFSNSYTIEYALNNQEVFTESYNGLNSGEVRTISLTNGLDFSQACENTLSITIISSTDVDDSNNGLEELIITTSNLNPNLIVEDSLTTCLTNGIQTLSAELATGVWSGPGVTETGDFDPAEAGEGFHEIVFETSAEGCPNSDTVMIEVLGVISGEIDASVEGQLTAPAAASYQWIRDGAYIEETSRTIIISGIATYAVELTNENGCVSVIEAGEITANQMALPSDYYSIYPNPAKEFININISDELTDVRAQLIGLDGKMIWEKTLNDTQNNLRVGNVHSGSYILKIISNEGLVVEQIIVNR